MKKKILSALLAAAMVLTSCLPVFAEGEVQPQPTPETPAVVNEKVEEFCDCGLAKGHEGECQKAAEEFCDCGLAKGHEGECQKAAEEFCECGLAKGHEGECQKAAEEFCECGLAKGHEGECQKAAEEFCDCGLAKGHEGECQKAAEEFCECGLAKGHEGECQKAAVVPEAPVQPEVSLYDALMACTTMEEVEALTAQYSEEELVAFMSGLNEEQLKVLQQHIYEMENEEIVIPKTVVFTDAGPFLPPVNVAVKQRRLMLANGTTEEEDALVLSKVAVPTADGKGYTITLEAYTTGTVTSETKTVPADIVLVLDQSGSMAYDFNGNRTSTDKDRRQYAMKAAVKNFIGSVAEKYTETADHRIAIVTFSDHASLQQGWTFVNEAGKNKLQGKISSLPNSPSGATNVAEGMEQAETLMGSKYTGPNTNRSKVVIVFTDGVPTTRSDFDVGVANGAIESAKALKGKDVTVYTVGIFEGADPTKLYGDSGFDKNSDGSIGSKWYNLRFLIFGDIEACDVPAGNRFLNYLSSNFKVATKIGIKKYEFSIGVASLRGWEITENFERTSDKYYLTADNSDSLNRIFQTISSNIETPAISLGTSAVIKDVVSDYFDMPAKTSDIKVYTAAANADGTFAARTESELRPTVSGNQVSVTGFNFDANCVTADKKSDGTYGKKLIIEFTVTPKTGFLGGNNVPTNDADSGIYTADGVVENFEVPTVNVPIPDVEVTALDKNIYLLGTVDENVMKTNASVTCGKVNLLGEIDPWKKEFVKIDVVAATKEDFNNIDGGKYTITATVSPLNDALETSKGTPAESKEGSDEKNIYVFKPEITFQDSKINLDDTANYEDNFVSVVWKHTDSQQIETSASEVTMTGTEPQLVYTYAPGASKFEEDTPVTVTAVKIRGADGDKNVDMTNTKFIRKKCIHRENCQKNDGPVTNGNPNFVVHIATTNLTIKKEGGNQGEVFIMTVEGDGQKFEVVVPADESVTITGLKVDAKYKVTEDENWAWRYDIPDPATITLQANPSKNTVIVKNKLNNNKWLSGTSYANNKFVFGEVTERVETRVETND